jgi:hypothetical protein
MKPRAGQSRLVWPAALAALVLIAGGIGRWGSDGVITVNGVDTSDGKIVIVAGAISLAMILVGAAIGRRWPFFMPTLLGAFAAVVCVLDLFDFKDAGATIGWGLYAGIVGSIATSGLGLALLATPPPGDSVVGDAPLER